jgi:hypothetical protein
MACWGLIKISEFCCFRVVIDHHDYIVIMDTLLQYHDDLPSPEVEQKKLLHWKNYCISKDSQTDYKLPEDFASAIKAHKKTVLPNIHTLLNLGCTVSVTSCKCEHKISSPWRISKYMWMSKSHERLSGLALKHIHYTSVVEAVNNLNKFAHKAPTEVWKHLPLCCSASCLDNDCIKLNWNI